MISAALVGTNSICRLHAEALLAFPERCLITALVDVNLEHAEALRRRYHLDCPIFSSHKELLASDVKVDLVHVCTPPFTHASIAIDCMNAGWRVLVEKPMAVSLAECDAMMEAERRNGVLLGVIAQNRFYTETNRVKQVLASGLLGKICCSHVHSHWWRGRKYYDLWWRGLWEKEGGGPTLNHAVHHIDLLNWMRGTEPTEVFAMLSNVMHDNSEVEDASLALLRYGDGTLGEVTSSVIHHGEGQSLTFQCERGKISTPWDVRANRSQPDGFPMKDEEMERRVEEYRQSIAPLPYEGHLGQVDDTLTAIETKGRPLVTSLDGRRTMELITAIYQSGGTGRLAYLPIGPDDEFYTFEGMVGAMRNVPL